MKKVFNFRFFVLLFLEFVLGHLFAVYICKNEYVLYAGFGILFVFIFVNALLGLCFKRKVIYYILCSAFCLLIFLTITGLSVLRVTETQKVNNLPQGVYQVSGKVVNVSHKGESITIENITLNDDIKCYKAQQMTIYMNGYVTNEVNLGDKVTFSAHLYFDVQPKLAGSSLNYNYNSVKNLKVQKSKSLDSKIRNSVKDNLYKNAEDSLVAEIQYAMLFGDKGHLDEELKESYTASGLAHLLAVSGLHIGFIITLFSKILDNIMRRRRWLCFGIKSVLIIGYLILCNFSTSATRAVVMSMVGMYATARGKKNDGLSALAFAGCVILLFNPSDFYNVGFQLSFMVVFGLFGIAPLIKDLLDRVLPDWLSSSLAVALSSQIASTPIILHYFGSTSLISVIVNLFVIPYVSFAFTLLFVAVIFTELIPPLGVVLKIPNALFKLLNIVVDAVARVSLPISFEKIGLFGLIFSIFAIIITSQYNLMKRSKKLKVVLALCVCIVFCIIKGW